MKIKYIISLIPVLFCLLFYSSKVHAEINYDSFNQDYPVSAYYPYSSNKANILGSIMKINNVRNDYSVSIPMDISQNSEGKLNYFGLTTSTNSYFTNASGNSITNVGSLTGPNPLVGQGIQDPVKLPIPNRTITIDGKTYFFNYFVVQVVKDKVISPISEVQGNNYALQPLDILPANANFAWAYYSDSPGAIIQYKTEDGQILLTSPNIIGEAGDTIPTESKTFDGYTLISSPESNTFKKDNLETLTYIYKKNPIVAGNVTIEYIDTEGNQLADKVVKSGNVGDNYSSEKIEIPGYSFKEVKGEPNGTFSAEEKTISYIYTKDKVLTGNVTIKYVDTEKNKIAEDITKSGNIGDNYTSEKIEIPGYSFKEIKGNPNGVFSTEEQVIYYIYSKNVNPVTAHYSKTPSFSSDSLKVNSSKSEGEKLPKTGDDSIFTNLMISIAGIVLISISFILTGFRKKK